MNDALSQSPNDHSDQNDSAVKPVSSPTPISIGPEGMSVIGSVETIAPTKIEASPLTPEHSQNSESLRSQENVVTVTNDNSSAKPQADSAISITSKNIEKKVEIVDKSTGKEKLHHIDQPLNDLTTKADLEEEDFIKHVEEIHTLQ